MKTAIVKLSELEGDNVVEFHDDKGQCILTVMREDTEKQQYLAVVVNSSRTSMSVETQVEVDEYSGDIYPREVMLRT